jgi:Tfp pilus assembly protein PilN
MTTYPDLTASPQPGPAPEPTTGTSTTSSTRVEWAPVPRVNLLPPEIVDGRRLGQLKRLFGGTLVVVAAGCAAAVVWAQLGVSSAQDEVDAAQARAASLQAEQAKYAEVPRIDSLIDTATTARQSALSSDVLWYGFLSDLSLTTPKGVSLISLEMTLDDSSTPSSAPADPLTTSGIGHVNFSGKASHFVDIASWLNAVSSVHGLDGSTLQTATRGVAGSAPTSGPITFTSTVQVTSKALSHRYDRKAD